MHMFHACMNSFCAVVRVFYVDALYCLSQVARANFNEDPYVRDFGMSIETKMVNVSGRILPPPLLQYGGKVRHSQGVSGYVHNS